MPIDDSVWHVLRERADAEAAAATTAGPGGCERHHAARLRMLDAAADALSACGALVAAMEDEVRERRQRLAAGGAGGAGGEAGGDAAPAAGEVPGTAPPQGRIDLSY
jgi:hypothetical protein